jgi:hypothetical protein
MYILNKYFSLPGFPKITQNEKDDKTPPDSRKLR